MSSADSARRKRRASSWSETGRQARGCCSMPCLLVREPPRRRYCGRTLPPLEAHRPLLWALAYRMTGVAADADEIVQESYVGALEHPPNGAPRAWLVRIASNRARARL